MRRIRTGLAFFAFREVEALLEVLLLDLEDERLRLRCWAKLNDENAITRRTAKRTLRRTTIPV